MYGVHDDARRGFEGGFECKEDQMKTINQHDIVSKKHLLKERTASFQRHTQEFHVVTQPFSERDIIWLQELFLTNGWHCLQVEDLHAGRSLINTMLYSLNYYHDVVCLTIEDHPLLDSSYFDVYLHLLEGEYLDGQPCDVEEFFIEHFYADFLWIEETSELVRSAWYQQFLQALQDLKMANHIPIIILSYK